MKYFLKRLRTPKSSRPNFKKRQKGFTAVEALVAITILLVGIVGPLALVSGNIQAGRFSRDQITAYYLAQEAIEVIRQERDSNLLAGDGWLDGLLTSNCFGNGCLIDGRLSLPPSGQKIRACGSGDCSNATKLCLYSSGYGHKNGASSCTVGPPAFRGVDTKFTRHVRLEYADPLSTDQVRIIVTVSFDAGNYIQNYETISYMSNWLD